MRANSVVDFWSPLGWTLSDFAVAHWDKFAVGGLVIAICTVVWILAKD